MPVNGFDTAKNKISVYTAAETAAALNDKVDKVEGKGLSTNDFTTPEKILVSTISGKQKQHTTTTTTINTSDWVQKQAAVVCTGVTADNTVFVSPTASSVDEYVACKVFCVSQSDGNLGFICNVVPSTALIVNVAIFGVTP